MLTYRGLFVFVEGRDDGRFFDAVIRPLIVSRYDHIEIRQYSERKRTWVARFLRSISQMGADYIFIGDFDNGPCVTLKKESLMDRYSGLESERIYVVKAEIESWYYAGLNRQQCSSLGLRYIADTGSLTKEQFNAQIPSEFQTRTEFMIELLLRYDHTTARRQNASVEYIHRKFVNR